MFVPSSFCCDSENSYINAQDTDLQKHVTLNSRAVVEHAHGVQDRIILVTVHDHYH